MCRASKIPDRQEYLRQLPRIYQHVTLLGKETRNPLLLKVFAFYPSTTQCDQFYFTAGFKIHRISQCAGCPHRRHRRLENLRTLNLADNLLSNVEIWCDQGTEEEPESKSAAHRTKLVFPNLNSLDVSNNRIRTIPNSIHELTNLSVFNISGNAGIKCLTILLRASLPFELTCRRY